MYKTQFEFGDSLEHVSWKTGFRCMASICPIHWFENDFKIRLVPRINS